MLHNKWKSEIQIDIISGPFLEHLLPNSLKNFNPFKPLSLFISLIRSKSINPSIILFTFLYLHSVYDIWLIYSVVLIVKFSYIQ